jgi:hypothetical protein
MRELAHAVRDGPDRISDGEGHTYLLGPEGYETGKLPTSRWFVVDGAGRIYPLHERYRQKIENVVYWPIRSALRWRDRRAGGHDRDA